MNLRAEAINIAVDGQHIEGTLIAPAKPGRPAAGVLFVHGWGGNQDHYLAEARAAAALGCVSLIFDLRGHAETEAQHETVTREDNLRDLAAAYDVLAGNAFVKSSFIALVGASYGAYLGALLLPHDRRRTTPSPRSAGSVPTPNCS